MVTRWTERVGYCRAGGSVPRWPRNDEEHGTVSQNPQDRPSDGQGAPRTADVGEPARAPEGDQRDEARPDLDDRERRISTRRKAMGPPLREREESREHEAERPKQEIEEPPVDPA